MQFRFPSALALFASLAVSAAVAMPLAAQGTCPMQTTQHVAGDVSYGPRQDCGRVDYQLIDVQIRLSGGGCPMFAIYVPPHDIAVPSPNQTYVDVVGQQPITMVLFECRTRWLLFLPIGSDCVATQQKNVGTVQSLVTRPCVPTTT